MSLDVSLINQHGEEIDSKNITHNLKDMWKEAGVYEALYLSEGKRAMDVLPALKEGLELMKENPERFKVFDSPNGWGKYKHALPWLEELVEKFNEHPDAVIEICR